MRRFLIEEYETIDVDLVRANRDQIYAIDLTLDGRACIGFEHVLVEPNICGIPVRKAIFKDTHVPFSDQEEEREALLAALRKLYRLASGRKLRVPQAGIGAGPYGLALHSPRIYHDLCRILADHFGYQQPSASPCHAHDDCYVTAAYCHALFSEVCRQGFYMIDHVAQKHGLTLEQLKAHCSAAGRTLEAQGKLFALHLPIYRWASDQ
ncbi:hypothetical protein [Pseudomonas sp. Marseille-Q5115]|uniref:hypothetical protein n=1 Tax=Pseudomonas sp. Marseille-Q5115 TaxID=2866593 RepID=UPI001CE45F7D|nr:hypothetical protein [Pseudomonas sp. Marseille-Q5115]